MHRLEAPRPGGSDQQRRQVLVDQEARRGRHRRVVPLPSHRHAARRWRRPVLPCRPAGAATPGMRPGIDRGGGDHLGREPGVVLAQLGLGRALGQQGGDLVHQDARAAERRRAALHRRVLDDQGHGLPVTLQRRVHPLRHRPHVHHVGQDAPLAAHGLIGRALGQDVGVELAAHRQRHVARHRAVDGEAHRPPARQAALAAVPHEHARGQALLGGLVDRPHRRPGDGTDLGWGERLGNGHRAHSKTVVLVEGRI